MKKVLLTSTALVMTAGFAAAEMTMTATAKLTYGNFGTGDYRTGYAAPLNGNVAAGAAAAVVGTAHTAATALANADGDFTAADLAAGTTARTAQVALRAVAGAPTAAETAAEDAAYLAAVHSSNADAAATPDPSWSSEADLDIVGSGGGGTIEYSATLEIDESGLDAGKLSIKSGGLTFEYDENDIGGLVSTGADGEDDNTGDYKISYAAGSLSASYETDTTSEDTVINLGYAMGDLTLGLEMEENDNATGGDATATTSVGYVMGDTTISLSADDADTWDASAAYVSGNTTMTVAADENSIYSVALNYAAGDMTFTARQEFGGTADADSETEFGITYGAGDLSFGLKYDSGDEGEYGDEAATVVSMGYAIDGATIAAKGNDQDEVEVSVAFTF